MLFGLGYQFFARHRTHSSHIFCSITHKRLCSVRAIWIEWLLVERHTIAPFDCRVVGLKLRNAQSIWITFRKTGFAQFQFPIEPSSWMCIAAIYFTLFFFIFRTNANDLKRIEIFFLNSIFISHCRVNFKKNEKAYNSEGSEVLKALKESENDPREPGK